MGAMGRRSKYPVEVRERAIRLVFEQQGAHESQWAAIWMAEWRNRELHAAKDRLAQFAELKPELSAAEGQSRLDCFEKSEKQFSRLDQQIESNFELIAKVQKQAQRIL